MADPCSSCSDQFLGAPGTVHARCADPTCGCSCRGAQLDIDDPVVRLGLGQRLLQVSQAEYLPGDTSPEADYVRGLVADFAREQMRVLFGIRTHEVDVETEPPLSADELVGVRSLLSAQLVTQEDISSLRSVQEQIPAVLRAVQQLQERVQEPEPDPEYEEPAPPARPQRPVARPQPHTQPAPRAKPRQLAAPTSKPMPSRNAMPIVTGQQAAQAFAAQPFDRSVQDTEG